jgi:hypothetical protein
MERTPAAQQALLFALLLVEGGVVLGHQIVAPKILEPLFGNSILVWSAVLVCTLGGLAAGYLLGDRYSRRPRLRRTLSNLILVAAAIVFMTPYLGQITLILSDPLPLTPGILTGSALVVTPLMMLLGACSPLAVAILHLQGWGPTRATGVVFAVSTVGGIVAAAAVAVWSLPLLGVRNTCLLAGTLLGTTSLLFRLVCEDT